MALSVDVSALLADCLLDFLEEFVIATVISDNFKGSEKSWDTEILCRVIGSADGLGYSASQVSLTSTSGSGDDDVLVACDPVG